MATTIASVLKIHPDNRSTITFGTLGVDENISGYYFQVGTLDLNEEARKEIIYSDIRATSINSNLTSINFDVLAYAPDRNSLIQLSQDLELAVCNPNGGYFEYKPENSTGISTFYRYEQSPVPVVIKSKINHWDNPITMAEQKYVLMLQVQLQSHAIGISDPDSPVFIAEKTFGGSTVLSSEIDSADIDGDQPAYLIIDVTNPTGSVKTLNRIYAFSRSAYESDTLASFDPLKLASDAVDDAGPWTTPSPAERYGPTVQRLTPASLDAGNWLEFTISDLDQHFGRISVFAVVKPSDDPENWRIRSRFDIESATIINNSDRFKPEHEDNYHWMYCGDLDVSDVLIPSTVPFTDGVIRLTIDKIAGTIGEHIDIDALLLIYQDESAMQVNVATDTTVGFIADETIKMDYMFDKAQRTVLHLDAASSLLGFAQAVFGSNAIEANPRFNTVIAFVAEAVSTDTNMASTYNQILTYCTAIFRTIYPFGG